MDIRLINAFCAVYEERSINKAAQRLNIAQPSISIAIRNLETDLRTQLFERSPVGTIPTAKAHVLYTRFQRVLAEIEGAKRSISVDLNDLKGPLRVGLPPVVTYNLLPQLLPQFLEDYPDVSLRIAEGLPGKLIEMTLAGEIDFAIIGTTAPVDERIVSRRIGIEPIVLISSRRHGSVAPGPVNLKSLPPLKMALSWAPYSIRNVLDRNISSENIRIARLVEVDTVAIAVDLVKQTDWVTLFPITGVARDLEELIAHEIPDLEMAYEHNVIRLARTTIPAAGLILIEAIEQTLGTVLESLRSGP